MSDADIVPSSSNPSTSIIDDETKEKLRGDRIGETMFSETFLLKTLLKLQDIQWNKDLEDDLTFLWDSTMESEVCDYLNKASFTSIACAIIETSTEERLLEILVGIIANILSNGKSIIMGEKYSGVVIKLLNCDDHLILIQVFRFIKALAFTESSVDCIGADDMQKIDFVLNNSRNLELLMVCLDALVKLTLDNRIAASKICGKLGLSTVVAHEAIKEILEVDQSENDNNFNKDVIKATNYVLGVLVNLLSYEDNRITTEMETDSNKIILYLFSLTTKTSLGYDQYFNNNQSCLDFLKYVISCFNFTCKYFCFQLNNIDDILLSFSLYTLNVCSKLPEHYEEFFFNFIVNLNVQSFLKQYTIKNCKEEDVKDLIKNIELIKLSQSENRQIMENAEELLFGLNNILKAKQKFNIL